MEKRTTSLLGAISLIFWVFGVSSLLSSCATTQRTYEAGAVGAGLGGLAGALIDSDNRWRGGVLGAFIGGFLAGTVPEISTKAAEESAEEGRPVVYQTND